MEDFIAILKCSSIHTLYSIMTKANIDFERGVIWKQSQFVYRNLSSSKNLMVLFIEFSEDASENV